MHTETVVTSLVITAILAAASAALTGRLRLEPTAVQAMLEGLYQAAVSAVSEVVPEHVDRVLPFIATLWVFILVANLVGIIPGLHSPTGDLSLTAALAVLVFLSVHVFGIRLNGWREYLAHYVQPNPVMLPFHLVSELSRTLALAVRLFGNVMSLEMTALLVLLVGGLLVPIPILMLHIVEALVQAYIFGMLALVYIGAALEAQAGRTSTKEKA
jgi:F-type H+-transporting ATPase subunit a